MKGAARLSGLKWDVVKDIEKRRLKGEYEETPISHLRWIGIDEIAIKRGHHYATIVVDLSSGRIVWVGEGRKVASLDSFLKRLKRSRAKLEAVSMDMSAAYCSAVEANFPSVPIVYDHFHIIQQMNKQLDELRRQYVRDVENKYRGTVKGVRWLVLMSSERLEKISESKPSYKVRLETALQFNKPLATGYYLKEKLRLLWSQPNRSKGEAFLESWCKEALASRLKPIQEMVSLLKGHWEGVLSYFDHPISNGPVEGIVHKIKNLKRAAYGYRDWEFFKLKLYGLHESRLELIG